MARLVVAEAAEFRAPAERKRVSGHPHFAHRAVGRVGAVALVFIVCSVVGIRQHYAVDALVGWLLALAFAAAALRPWRPDPSHPPARQPRYALGCVALYVFGVSSFGLAFLLGR